MEGLSALRLILDISQSADGRVTGQAQAPGEQAVPFSGLLELLKTIEDALLGNEETEPALGPAEQVKR